MKRKSGKKVLKRKQKIRLEQGRERAQVVNGKLERKVERAERMKEGKKKRNVSVYSLPSRFYLTLYMPLVSAFALLCPYELARLGSSRSSKEDCADRFTFIIV